MTAVILTRTAPRPPTPSLCPTTAGRSGWSRNNSACCLSPMDGRSPCRLPPSSTTRRSAVSHRTSTSASRMSTSISFRRQACARTRSSLRSSTRTRYLPSKPCFRKECRTAHPSPPSCRSVARVLPTLVLRSANLATQRPRLQRSSVQRSHCAPRPPTLVDNHARFRSASHATAFLPSRGRTCSSRSMTRRHVPPLPKLCRPTPIGTEATTSPSTVRVSSLWAQTLSASSARSSRCQPRSSRPSR
mmetsp:Transcript_15298/g.46625  ORF Transcript_15298/g.46625 Transcript_15298/m.46625 type:complete len:245 (+) Transcript_15298:1475-2209(+)